MVENLWGPPMIGPIHRPDMTTKPRGLRRNPPARTAVATISMLLGVPGLLVASDVDSLSVVKIQRYQQFGSVIVSLAGIEGPAAIAPFALEARNETEHEIG